jgi:hypothetical protein
LLFENEELVSVVVLFVDISFAFDDDDVVYCEVLGDEALLEANEVADVDFI